ncbi:protein tyrosine phosphatase family protein [Mucilaginibacter ginsenosidivorans]|uniref:Phosphatase n=1 Tax=Mucilaginibacter ginsenosidivorans TaxID=398053 RepID=A0A5B8V1J3_9SPHI|nr:protein tyrosine phosphatase family protein [Mucilaginibacter ginsenosidivorans]QEC65300.1 phosphatase [Mucilaginibacter ginsenosidivorans]
MRGIYHFEKISDTLACAGQPTEEQFSQLVNGQYEVVINLGLLNTKYALPDEAALVASLGIRYYHIPVVFENPQLTELDKFITLMDQNADKRVFVHCAANYRASVFTGLYLFAAGKLPEEELQDFVEDVWQPNTVWQQFLEDGIEHINDKK